MRSFFVACCLVISFSSVSYGARIKDLVEIRGVRPNQLVGYGLVVGLPSTGDSRRTSFTNQSLASFLLRMGVKVPSSGIEVRNTAAVIVTADLPPFSGPGERIDVLVNAIGDSTSLASGTLLMTPLKGADGKVYVVAQGPLVVGGFGISSSLVDIRKNNPTSARIPSGGIVERGIVSEFVTENKIVLLLKEADFTTSGRIADAINTTMQGELAKAINPGMVQIQMPSDMQDAPVSFVSQIELIDVTVDTKAKVVISERTGTVVIGGGVAIGSAAISHGNLSVSVVAEFGVSQPPPLSKEGVSVLVPSAGVTVFEETNELKTLKPTTTVEDLVQALNALGASPRDLMAILQALKQVGALRAELEVI